MLELVYRCVCIYMYIVNHMYKQFPLENVVQLYRNVFSRRHINRLWKKSLKIRNVVSDKYSTSRGTSRHTLVLPIGVVICNSDLVKDSFLISCPEIKTIEYSAKTST